MKSRLCCQCAKRKPVEAFDLSGRRIKNGVVSSICKKCSNKVKYRRTDGKATMVFAGGWTMPTPFFKAKNKWGECYDR